jgi:integrase/recombinase XerD
VVRATERLWRSAHLTYDQARDVGKLVRRRLELQRPKRRGGAIERLGQAEAEHFVRHAYAVGGGRGLLVKTLLQTGARVAEFVAIKVDCDLYLDECMVLLRGKGKKDRYVPILPALAQELATHLGARRTGYLFESRLHRRYSTRRVQQIVRELAASAGITRRVHPHLLRHTIAQHLLEAGMAIDQVQQFLGHEDLATTQIYAQSTTAMMRDGYRRAMSSGART